jgi:CheY-like chemotaxis protein
MNGMTRPPIKILVADDDPEDLELMEEHILSVEPRAQLEKFMDGLSAYEFLHSRPDTDLPSLIILDYNMPGLNGCQVLSSIKSATRYTSIPKVILSNSNTPKYIEECLHNGATEYIVKPSSMDAIHNLAKKLVTLAESH